MDLSIFDLITNPAILGSTVAVIALIVDWAEKRMDKQGVFADLKDLALNTGKGLGKMWAGIIPGKKIEPEANEVIEQLEKIMVNFVNGVQEGLVNKEDDDNQK